jgi:hypothetical protein
LDDGVHHLFQRVVEVKRRTQRLLDPADGRQARMFVGAVGLHPEIIQLLQGLPGEPG